MQRLFFFCICCKRSNKPKYHGKKNCQIQKQIHIHFVVCYTQQLHKTETKWNNQVKLKEETMHQRLIIRSLVAVQRYNTKCTFTQKCLSCVPNILIQINYCKICIFCRCYWKDCFSLASSLVERLLFPF